MDNLLDNGDNFLFWHPLFFTSQRLALLQRGIFLQAKGLHYCDGGFFRLRGQLFILASAIFYEPAARNTWTARRCDGGFFYKPEACTTATGDLGVGWDELLTRGKNGGLMVWLIILKCVYLHRNLGRRRRDCLCGKVQVVVREMLWAHLCVYNNLPKIITKQ